MRLLHLTAAALLIGNCACSSSSTTTAAAPKAADKDTATAADVQAANAKPADAAAVTAPAAWNSGGDLAPYSVHLTWQHDPTSTITVQWATTALDLQAYTPKVWFGEAAYAGADAATLPFAAALTATGSGEVYQTNGTSAGASDSTQAVTWTVECKGLKPDTAYVFRAGTWGGFDAKTGTFTTPELSEVGHFRTAPQKGSKAKFSVVLAGDSRGGIDQIKANVDRLGALDATFWFFNGDFTNLGLQSEWDSWIGAMQPVMRHHVLMPVQGNHEIFADMFYAQFALPVMAGLPGGYIEHAWSFNFANVHFIGLDSNADANVQDQVAWLEADLQAARQDPDIDWIVPMSHHPAFSACLKHGSNVIQQQYWSPLFEKYNVELVFSGHDHNYERTKPVRDGKAVGTGEGPVYVVAGGFYSPPYENGTDWWTATSAPGSKHNYVVMTVEGKKLSFKAYSGDGSEVLDDVTLQKP